MEAFSGHESKRVKIAAIELHPLPVLAAKGVKGWRQKFHSLQVWLADERVQAKLPAFLLLNETLLSWKESKTPRLGAALAFYTVFAIAPLFLIVLRVSSLWFGENAARHELFGQLHGLLGDQGGKAIEALVTAAASKPQTGWWAACLATATLIVAATGMFVELQDALNTIWKVERADGRGFFRFVKDRLLSFAMVMVVGFLLLVSLVISAGLAGLGQYVHGRLAAEHLIWEVLNFSLSLGLITVLFAMILKVLPDVKLAWRDVWMGGLISAILFNFGKFLLGYYVGRSSIASAYGATGSLVVLLLWVYYSAQILLLGAELTRAYAMQYGSQPPAAMSAQSHRTGGVKSSRKKSRGARYHASQ